MAFLLESIMKLLAMGPRWYFLDPWNSFDFIVLGISGVSLAVVFGRITCAVTQFVSSTYDADRVS